MAFKQMHLYFIVLIGVIFNLNEGAFAIQKVRWITCQTPESVKDGTKYLIELDLIPSHRESCFDELIVTVSILHDQFPHREFLEEFTVYGYLTENQTLQNYYGEGFNFLIRRGSQESPALHPETPWPASFRTSYPSRAGNRRGPLVCYYTPFYREKM